jgi:hypothetical protein
MCARVARAGCYLRAPQRAGKEVRLVSTLQTLSNGRVGFAGSLDMFRWEALTAGGRSVCPDACADAAMTS